jgi:hypothetical protein
VGADQGKRRELREEAEHRESERDRLDGVIKSKDKLRELGVGPQLASILSSTVPVRDNLGSERPKERMMKVRRRVKESQDQDGEVEKMHRSKSVRGVDKAGKVSSMHPLECEGGWLYWGVVMVTITLRTRWRGRFKTTTHLYSGDSGLADCSSWAN